MRILIAISIVVASVSSASAQFAMDHGNAAAAMQAAYEQRAYEWARAANGKPLPSQQTNFAVGGSAKIKVIQRTAEETKAHEAAEIAWRERCKPSVVEDREGIRRVKYAERDCDLSRFNTAGN